MAKSKEEKIYKVLPQGRLLNSAFFTKDVYKDEESGAQSTPQYRAELAYEKGGEIEAVIDWACDLIRAEYGDKVYIEGLEDPVPDCRPVQSPFRNGDFIAEDRESRDKVADAYKNTWVIRPNTIYDKEGRDGPGGIFVLDMDAETEIEALDAGKVYNGSYGRVKISPSFYKMNGKLGMKFYLVAYQKTDDGAKLSNPVDHRKDFAPAKGRTSGDGAQGRRSRKG
jgi:hypothetical protein